MIDFEVVVVGAGPAGATAARHCAMHNLKTLLIEKERIPRDKPCAGGITLAAAKELDFTLPPSIVERECNSVQVIYGKVRKLVRYPDPVVLMVTRKRFDEYLVHKAAEAGTVVQDDEECLSISRDTGGVTIQTTRRKVRAGIVIGADGFYSRVMKSIRRGFDKDETRFCALAEIPLSEQEITERWNNLMTIHYGYIPMSYAWLFPKRDYVSAGIGVALSKCRDFPDKLREFLTLNGLRTDVKIRGCFLPVSRFRHDVYANRIMLVGDAAGFADSFSGEGIRFAINSGKLAALTAAKAYERGDFSAEILKDYQKNFNNSLGSDLQLSNRIIDHLLSRTDLLIGTIVRNKKALQYYQKTMTGELTLREFVSWLKRRMPYYFFKRFLLFQ